MASLEKRRWEGDPAGLTRRDRRPCDYAVYLPDLLAGRRFVLDGDVAADIADAEAALVALDAPAASLAGTEAVARLLLRAESIGSSRIEGLEVGGRRLLRAVAGRQRGEAAQDATASAVLGNVDAMVWGVEDIEPAGAITLQTLLEAHRRLLAASCPERHGGRIRTVQNWTGGGSFHPGAADFVPPPPELVPTLLDDLLAFCNDDSLPALAQAAIAYAQFETIHPFVDGNGRTGRVLVHLVLRRRGLGLRVLPPVSLILATWWRDYAGGLTGTRYVGSPDSAEPHAGANRWIALFAAACRRAADDAARFEARVRALRSTWVARAGRPRRDSAAYLLIEALPASPMLTTSTAAALIDRSFQAASQAIDRLVGAGVLAQVNVGQRNRTFEVPELIEAFTALEQGLTPPGGNTRVSQ